MIHVYTALFGDQTRDRIRRPPPDPAARFVCFTDTARLSVPGWEIEQVSGAGRSPQFLARLFKARPDRWFGRSATTIWLDASCELLVPPSAVLGAVPTAIGGFRHPDRASLEDEVRMVLQLGAAPEAVVLEQLQDYRRLGFDTNVAAVTTTGLLVRTPAAHGVNLLWEEQIIRYHLRDQLSLDYCAWATHTAITHLPGHYRQNPFMRYHAHLRLAC